MKIDSKKLYNFRKNACENQADGLDRALWYDKKEKRFFETCETSSTNYVFDNPEDILCLIFVNGNNNSEGLQECCEGCTGCTDDFMIEHNIKMSYPDFHEYMEKLYWKDDKSNEYNISKEEIEQYHENDSCSWFCDYIDDVCLVDILETFYPIKPYNWGTCEHEDIEIEEI